MNKHQRSVLFSSEDSTWETPHFLFSFWNSLYNFKLDAAASDTNHLCPKYYTEEQNSLIQEWESSNWLNAPYSPNHLQKAFMVKVIEQVQKQRLTLCLMPVRTETKIWQEIVFKYAEVIWYIDERIHYSYHPNPVGFPSAGVLFTPNSVMEHSPRGGEGLSIVANQRTLELKSLLGYEEYKAKVKHNRLLLKEQENCSVI